MLLVTGVTGNSGGHFIRELASRGYTGKIRCIARSTSDTSILDKSNLDVDLIVGDLADKALVSDACRGVDTILHIASIHHSPTIVEAAVDNHVRRAILVHTTGVFSAHKSASQRYLEIEEEIKDTQTKAYDSISETQIIILRPTMIFGHLDDRNMSVFIRMVDKLRLLPLIDGGRNLLQPVHGRDLGKAYYQIVCALNPLDNEYILSGDRPVSMRELMTIIGRSLGKKSLFFNVPTSVASLLAQILKVITVGRLDFIERVLRMGENRAFPHDSATADFGYSPALLEESILMECHEYLENEGRLPGPSR